MSIVGYWNWQWLFKCMFGSNPLKPLFTSSVYILFRLHVDILIYTRLLANNVLFLQEENFHLGDEEVRLEFMNPKFILNYWLTT